MLQMNLHSFANYNSIKYVYWTVIEIQANDWNEYLEITKNREIMHY